MKMSPEEFAKFQRWATEMNVNETLESRTKWLRNTDSEELTTLIQWIFSRYSRPPRTEEEYREGVIAAFAAEGIIHLIGTIKELDQ